MLPSHWAKLNPLPPLHLPATLCPVVSLLEPKLKHQICTIAIGYPPRTTRFPPFTAIKKIISTLATVPTTQLCLHFSSFLSRAPCHHSSTHRRRSISPLSRAHHPSAQWHPRWRTSQPSFAFWTTYRHVNSRKKIFWNTAASHGVIN
jgi:hypothetical protein